MRRGRFFGPPRSVDPGGTGKAFAGHGTFTPGDGWADIPEGTSLTMRTPHGGGISNQVGSAIERGDRDEVSRLHNLPVDARSGINLHSVNGAATYLPGNSIHNYTLHNGNNLNMMQNSIRTRSAVDINSLLQPGMGNMHWAACRRIMTK
ncbi:MAG: putative adhesin [Phycisphaerales bacterium JB065]